MNFAGNFLQPVIDGLVLGSFYALVALGYSMVYGIIKLLNFAHGDIYMIGAFSCLTAFGVVSHFLTGWVAIAISILIAMIIAAIVSFLAQRFAYRPLLGAPRLTLLITAIGVSLVLYNSVMGLTNSQPLFFTSGLDNSLGLKFGSITIS